MNYSESSLIKSKIEAAKSILICGHRHPDPDSIASCLALRDIFSKWGKESFIVCADETPDFLKFLKDSSFIKHTDFSSFDFGKYDLLVALDTASWERIVDTDSIKDPQIPIIVIDHHKDNANYGEVNLIDTKVSSCCEVIYKLANDWGININSDLATYLMTGIFGDTGGLQFSSVAPDTYRVVADLDEKGADKDRIILNLFKSYDFEMLSFIGYVLSKLSVSKEKKYAWAGVDYDNFLRLGKPKEGKGTVIDLFFQQVKDTDFGFVIVEYEPKKFTVSFRSRTGVDISQYAKMLGGGGHKYAASARFEATNYDEASGRVLDIVNK